jgi:hypothetical protein
MVKKRPIFNPASWTSYKRKSRVSQGARLQRTLDKQESNSKVPTAISYIHATLPEDEE